MPAYKKTLKESDRRVIVDELSCIMIDTASRLCRIADDFGLDRDYMMIVFSAYIECTLERGTWKYFDTNEADKGNFSL